MSLLIGCECCRPIASFAATPRATRSRLTAIGMRRKGGDREDFASDDGADEQLASFDLHCGDAVLYRGIDCRHGRTTENPTIGLLTYSCTGSTGMDPIEVWPSRRRRTPTATEIEAAFARAGARHWGWLIGGTLTFGLCSQAPCTARHSPRTGNPRNGRWGSSPATLRAPPGGEDDEAVLLRFDIHELAWVAAPREPVEPQRAP